MLQLAEEIETPGAGRIKALSVVAGNPVLSAPNGQRLAAALDRLNFMVSLDIYCNETASHADVILPGLSVLEEGHYDVPFPQRSHRNQARYSPAVFAAPAGQPPGWQTRLRLVGILRGRPADRDIHALDDKLLADDLPTLAKGPERCTLLVHPVDAKRLGLIDGGLAQVQCGSATLQAPVVIRTAMMPGVVSLPHGWGHSPAGSRLQVAAQRPGANLNAVLDDSLIDPLSGNAVLSGVAVRVRPVAAVLA